MELGIYVLSKTSFGRDCSSAIQKDAVAVFDASVPTEL